MGVRSGKQWPHFLARQKIRAVRCVCELVCSGECVCGVAFMYVVQVCGV
jgi:hypothetical protein